MRRRNFIKLSIAASTAIFLPNISHARNLNLSDINFSTANNASNNAQTIMVFLYGGASELAGNLTNIEEIKAASQADYDSYFRGLTNTTNNLWQEAGGTHMEDLLASGDMTLFRTCHSLRREETNNKAHGLCTVQNQKGSFDEDSAGIISNLSLILEANNIINSNTVLPFITLEGESHFYAEGDTPIASYLRPASFNSRLDNPYGRNVRHGIYYTREERDRTIPISNFDPELTNTMDEEAQRTNIAGRIRDVFSRRKPLSTFIDSIADTATPNLGVNAYPIDNRFAQNLETAIKLLSGNPDTKIVTIGTRNSLGSWDDHNAARDYVHRMESLFVSLKSAMAHIRAVGKEQNINIMVFGEFGRNVNLNSSQGWDHGNLQNLYVLGGHGYFNHKGVVGETILENTGRINRLFLKPKQGTYQFEPLSVAATLYKIYGIENPDILTGGNPEIRPLFT